MRTNIPLESLHWHIFSQIIRIFQKDYFAKYIKGVVVDENNKTPVKKALVYIVDNDGNKILAKAQTTRFGEFKFKKFKAEKYKFLVVKKGFEEHPFFEFTKESLENPEKITLAIEKDASDISTFKRISLWAFDNFLIFVFSLCIANSIVFELIMGVSFGWLRAAPFIILSFINMAVWIAFFKPGKINRGFFNGW